eukprot:COSAG01_NODE_768_length_13739_cov_6.271334_2_plen_268_part_00
MAGWPPRSARGPAASFLPRSYRGLATTGAQSWLVCAFRAKERLRARAPPRTPSPAEGPWLRARRSASCRAFAETSESCLFAGAPLFDPSASGWPGSAAELGRVGPLVLSDGQAAGSSLRARRLQRTWLLPARGPARRTRHRQRAMGRCWRGAAPRVVTDPRASSQSHRDLSLPAAPLCSGAPMPPESLLWGRASRRGGGRRVFGGGLATRHAGSRWRWGSQFLGGGARVGKSIIDSCEVIWMVGRRRPGQGSSNTTTRRVVGVRGAS